MVVLIYMNIVITSICTFAEIHTYIYIIGPVYMNGPLQGVEKRHGDENVFAWSDGQYKKGKTGISDGGPGPARKNEEVNQSSKGGRSRRGGLPLWQQRVEVM